jgi:hypothetical protein
MFEQDATAEEMAAYSVTVQVVPPLPANVELFVGAGACVVGVTALALRMVGAAVAVT